MSEHNKHNFFSVYTMRKTFAVIGVITLFNSALLSASPLLAQLMPTANAATTATSKQAEKIHDKVADTTDDSGDANKFYDAIGQMQKYGKLSNSQLSWFKNLLDKLDLQPGNGLTKNAIEHLQKGELVGSSTVTALQNKFKSYQAKQDQKNNTATAGSDGSKDNADSDPIATVAGNLAAQGTAGNALAKKIEEPANNKPGNAIAFMAKGNSFLGLTSKSSYTASYVSLFDARSDGSTASRVQQEHGSNDSGALNGIKNSAWEALERMSPDNEQANLRSQSNTNQLLQNQAASSAYMMALTNLGLVHSDSSNGFDSSLTGLGRYIFGAVVVVGNMASSVVNWIFKMVSYLANIVNPVKWMTGGRLNRDNPADSTTQPMSPIEAEGTTPTIFQEIGYMFYKLFFYAQKLGMTGAALSLGIGLATGILGWKMSGKIQKGTGIGGTIARFFLRSFLILALPLILSALLSSVMSNVAAAYGQHRASSSDYAIYSNLVDFEDWVQNSRLDLPPTQNGSTQTSTSQTSGNPFEAKVKMGDDDSSNPAYAQQTVALNQSYGDAGTQLISSPYVSDQGAASHQLILSINAYSAAQPGALNLVNNVNQNKLLNNPLEASSNAGTTNNQSQLAKERTALVNKWFSHETYTAGDWTSFVKSQLMSQNNNNGNKIASILSNAKNPYGTNGTLDVAKRGGPFVTDNPTKASGTAVGTNSQEESISDTHGGLSTIGMTNALSTLYRTSDLNYVSANSLNNSITAPQYYSVGLAGRGIQAMGNYATMVGLIWSTVILGFFFSISALQAILWCIPRLLGYLLAAATGSFKAACKSITVVLGLIIELEAGAILYLLFQELIVSFSQITNQILSSASGTNPFSGDSTVTGANNIGNIFSVIPHMSGVSNAIAGDASPTMYGIVNGLFGLALIGVAWSLVKVRTRIINIFTSLITGFFDALFQVVDNSLGGASAFQANAYTSSMNESTSDANGPGTDTQAKAMSLGKQALGQDASGDSMDVNHDDQELGDSNVPPTDGGRNGTGSGSQPYVPPADGATFGPGGQQSESSSKWTPDNNSSGGGGGGGIGGGSGQANINPNAHKHYSDPAGTMKSEYFGGDGRKAQPFNTIGGIMKMLGGSGHGGILSNLIQAIGNPSGLGKALGLTTSSSDAAHQKASQFAQAMGGSSDNTGEINKLAGMSSIGNILDHSLGTVGQGLSSYGSNNADASAKPVTNTDSAFANAAQQNAANNGQTTQSANNNDTANNPQWGTDDLDTRMGDDSVDASDATDATNPFMPQSSVKPDEMASSEVPDSVNEMMANGQSQIDSGQVNDDGSYNTLLDNQAVDTAADNPVVGSYGTDQDTAIDTNDANQVDASTMPDNSVSQTASYDYSSPSVASKISSSTNEQTLGSGTQSVTSDAQKAQLAGTTSNNKDTNGFATKSSGALTTGDLRQNIAQKANQYVADAKSLDSVKRQTANSYGGLSDSQRSNAELQRSKSGYQLRNATQQAINHSLMSPISSSSGVLKQGATSKMSYHQGLKLMTNIRDAQNAITSGGSPSVKSANVQKYQQLIKTADQNGFDVNKINGTNNVRNAYQSLQNDVLKVLPHDNK